MRLTLIALLLAGVVGCDSDRRTRPPQPPVEEPKPDTENGGEAEPVDAEEQYRLGKMYDYGDDVPIDEAKAVKWYRKAAEQGHAYAQSSLSGMYFFGRGVREDHAEGAKWTRKAADQGLPHEQYNLGSLYEYGDGLPEDDVEAYAWYSLAATNGDEDAKRELPKAKAKLTPEQLAVAEKRIEELTEQINANKAK